MRSMVEGYYRRCEGITPPPHFVRSPSPCGGGDYAKSSPRFRGEGDRAAQRRGGGALGICPSTAFGGPPPQQKLGRIS